MQVLAARASLAGRAVPARASRVERMATRQTAFTVSASGSATVGKGQGDLEMVSPWPLPSSCIPGAMRALAHPAALTVFHTDGW